MTCLCQLRDSLSNLNKSQRIFLAVIVATAIASVASPSSADNPVLIKYFDAEISTSLQLGGSNVAIGAFTYDALTDSFWTAGFTNSNQQIRHIAFNGTAWAATGTGLATATNGHVSETTWYLYKRSDNTQATGTPNDNSDWQSSNPLPGGLTLNPKPITINSQVYAPGTLMLVSDGGSVVDSNPTSVTTSQPGFTKRLYWYNLTETGSTPSGPTTAPGSGVDYNGNSVVDWNEQFMTIITHQHLLNADGDFSSVTSSNLGRSHALSTDGQSAYMVDSASNLGGIYKINLTTTGAVTKVLDADASPFNTEPGVVHTSVRNLNPSNLVVGDQILVEGSAGLGNLGGVNFYLDNGTFNTTPNTLFTAAQFQDFAEMTTTPSFGGITSDAAGNLYIVEDSTNTFLFKYDTAGRFSKVVGQAERRVHIAAEAAISGNHVDGYNANILDLQVRTNTSFGFSVPEILFTDSAFDAPIGAVAFKVGDFDRDNDVDATDRSSFLAALRPRGQTVVPVGPTPASAFFRFDLNSNGLDVDPTSAVDFRSIVDWKDAKILQQYLGFPNGDTNLDGLLDFTDIDMMEANYYTLGGPADKTWGDGDFDSLDPLATTYLASAADANIVNLVDLQVLADTWLNLLGLPNLTFDDLDEQGYSGQFREDLIFAFDIQAEAVPEPSTLALMGLAGVGLVVMAQRRRRQMRRSAGR